MPGIEQRINHSPESAEVKNNVKYDWEGVVARDGSSSRYLTTRLFLETVPGISSKEAEDIDNLDTFLTEQLPGYVSSQRDNLEEKGWSGQELEDLVNEYVQYITQSLTYNQLREEIKKLSSNSSQKFKDEYSALEKAILKQLDLLHKNNAEVHYPWKTEVAEYVDPATGEHVQISFGSYFALEARLVAINNKESKLASHVFGQNKFKNVKKGKGAKEEDLHEVALKDKFTSLDEYLISRFEAHRKEGLNLPEEAENEADAVRLLSKAEIEEWFVKRYEEFEQDAGVNSPGLSEADKQERRLQAVRNYKDSGFEKLYFTYFPEEAPLGYEGINGASNGLPEDSGVEVGSARDLEVHKKRWEAQKNREVLMPEIPNARGVEVPAGVVADFYAGSKQEGMEIGEGGMDRLGKITIDWSGLDHGEDFIYVEFNYQQEDKKRGVLRQQNSNIVINLPQEALALAKNGNREVLENIVRNCLEKNKGSRHAQINYDRGTGTILFGLGEKNAPEIGVKLSPQNLKKIAGTRAGEVDRYVDIRARAFTGVDSDVEAMWDFDKFILEQYVPGKNKKLKQLVWDEAFRQIFEATVGMEKLQELKEKVIESAILVDPNKEAGKFIASKPGVRSPVEDRNKWIKGLRQVEQSRFQSAENNFLNSISQEFKGDYKAFLSSGRFLEFANNADLKVSVAINFLAKVILKDTGREQEYNEFLEFQNLPNEKQLEYLNNKGVDVSNKFSLQLLAMRLNMFLGSNEDGDVKLGKVKSSKPTMKKPTVITNPGVNKTSKVEVQSSIDSTLASILEDAKKIAGEEYFEDNDIKAINSLQ